ncbi:MAG: hypothetical protein NT090_27240 [Acidobacteria bacterium]|nr:hypothetical protein [Acidobacteriota bacterium]
MTLRLLALLALLAAPAPRYFIVRVTDSETGRGVPLMALKLPDAVEYWTDSAGVAALDEPTFENREVFVEIRGHNPQGPQPCVPHEARAQG